MYNKGDYEYLKHDVIFRIFLLLDLLYNKVGMDRIRSGDLLKIFNEALLEYINRLVYVVTKKIKENPDFILNNFYQNYINIDNNKKILYKNTVTQKTFNLTIQVMRPIFLSGQRRYNRQLNRSTSSFWLTELGYEFAEYLEKRKVEYDGFYNTIEYVPKSDK